MKSNVVELRVYYSDTDHGGVVYYSNYFKWFEIGRTELLRDHGVDYAQFEKKGVIAPVAEAHCNYKSPCQYNDIVLIKTSIEKLGNSSIKFAYEIVRKIGNQLMAEGYTSIVFVDKKTMKPTPIPKELRDSLEKS